MYKMKSLFDVKVYITQAFLCFHGSICKYFMYHHISTVNVIKNHILIFHYYFYVFVDIFVVISLLKCEF